MNSKCKHPKSDYCKWCCKNCDENPCKHCEAEEEVAADYADHLRAEVDRLEKELKIADERWQRAENHHREVHESATNICTGRGI